MKEFEKLDTSILGCSGDDVEAQTKFKLKHKLNFPLLADTEFEVIEPYGARRMKSFLGKSFLGIVRMTFWIGPDGIIQRIWDKVTPKGHAAEVIAAIKADNSEEEAGYKVTRKLPLFSSISALSIRRVFPNFAAINMRHSPPKLTTGSRVSASTISA